MTPRPIPILPPDGPDDRLRDAWHYAMQKYARQEDALRAFQAAPEWDRMRAVNALDHAETMLTAAVTELFEEVHAARRRADAGLAA